MCAQQRQPVCRGSAQRSTSDVHLRQCGQKCCARSIAANTGMSTPNRRRQAGRKEPISHCRWAVPTLDATDVPSLACALAPYPNSTS